MPLVRSVLAVPGSSQKFLDKAHASAADVIMVDWEDGVAAADKADARAHTQEFLVGTHSNRQLWVRANTPGTPEFAKDSEAIDAWTSGASAVPVIVPMATLNYVRVAAQRLPSRPLIAMIETASGVEESPAIAAEHAVTGLMFGEYDYLATMAGAGSIGLSDTTWAKARLVNAAAAAGKWAIAGPTADFSDTDGLQRTSEKEAGLGFAGKLCIHPVQLPTVNDAFSPAPSYLNWAEELLAELGRSHPLDGAFSFRGQMVDAPVIERARTAVRMAGDQA